MLKSVCETLLPTLLNRVSGVYRDLSDDIEDKDPLIISAVWGGAGTEPRVLALTFGSTASKTAAPSLPATRRLDGSGEEHLNG